MILRKKIDCELLRQLTLWSQIRVTLELVS